ncbi:hypothetical protein [Pseudomonas sp. CCI2.4]|uniref:hypothetical protein n=1 Tax=Pseudomonas sp. CCI2.4 TaxID=3048617 RepID=UPI002B23AD51|nr:hypothetical protein [Pseudomonas sp. CCI2.4]MEB0133575.1 hypothetical protein [Pseudomonas sp. CCI2.4]
MASAALIVGCSKLDKDICWKQETKDAVAAIIGSQSKQIGQGVDSAVANIDFRPSMPLNVDMKSSDYSLERIDRDTGIIDCSAKLSITLAYSSTKTLKSEGKVFFSSRDGEHGRYIEVSKTNAQSIAEGLR